MTLDDRRLSRCLHMLAIAIAVVALSMFLPFMARVMGDDMTAGVSLSIAATFVGTPAMIGLLAWSDRSSARTPIISTYLILCGILSTGVIAAAIRMAVSGRVAETLVWSCAALAVSIALATAAAFIRDRGYVAVVA